MQYGKLARLGAGVVGVGRALTGVYFMARPGDGARMWVGDDSTASAYLARAVGARDLVIGLGVVRALANGDDPRPWVLASTVGDGLDAGFAALMLEGEPRKKGVVVAGGFGVLGAAVSIALGHRG